MSQDHYALKLHNDDVTAMESVVDLLCDFGFSKREAIDLMVAVHKHDGFYLEIGSNEQMRAREAQLRQMIGERGLALVTSVAGPVTQTELEDRTRKLRAERRFSLQWKGLGILAFLVACILAIVLLR